MVVASSRRWSYVTSSRPWSYATSCRREPRSPIREPFSEGDTRCRNVCLFVCFVYFSYVWVISVFFCFFVVFLGGGLFYNFSVYSFVLMFVMQNNKLRKYIVCVTFIEYYSSFINLIYILSLSPLSYFSFQPVLHDWLTKAVVSAILSVGWCI